MCVCVYVYDEGQVYSSLVVFVVAVVAVVAVVVVVLVPVDSLRAYYDGVSLLLSNGNDLVVVVVVVYVVVVYRYTGSRSK